MTICIKMYVFKKKKIIQLSGTLYVSSIYAMYFKLELLLIEIGVDSCIFSSFFDEKQKLFFYQPQKDAFFLDTKMQIMPKTYLCSHTMQEFL